MHQHTKHVRKQKQIDIDGKYLTVSNKQILSKNESKHPHYRSMIDLDVWCRTPLTFASDLCGSCNNALHRHVLESSNKVKTQCTTQTCQYRQLLCLTSVARFSVPHRRITARSVFANRNFRLRAQEH